MIEKYRLIYETNKAFHDYVNRLMNPKKNFGERTLEEVLSMRTVQDIGDYYVKNSNSNDSPVSPVSPIDVCSCDDRSC